MKTWQVYYSEPAESDLEDIYCYIAEELQAPDTALKLTKRIMDRIGKLDEMPKRHPVVRNAKWNERGLRRMNVENFAVFYLPDDDERIVNIVRILYGGRDMDEIL